MPDRVKARVLAVPLSCAGLVRTEDSPGQQARGGSCAEAWTTAGPGWVQFGCLPVSSCEALPLTSKGSGGPGSSRAGSVVSLQLASLSASWLTAWTLQTQGRQHGCWKEGGSERGRGLQPALDSGLEEDET